MSRNVNEILFSGAYTTKEVAQVCLNCNRSNPNCGEGCIEYLRTVQVMSNKAKGKAGGRKAFNLSAYGIEFTFPQLAAAVGYTAVAVRQRMKRYDGNAEKLCESFHLMNACDLDAALKRGG